MRLLDAFNKDRLSGPPPKGPPAPGAPPLPGPPGGLPPPPPPPIVDPKTQELINEKLKRAEELGEAFVLAWCIG